MVAEAARRQDLHLGDGGGADVHAPCLSDRRRRASSGQFGGARARNRLQSVAEAHDPAGKAPPPPERACSAGTECVRVSLTIRSPGQARAMASTARCRILTSLVAGSLAATAAAGGGLLALRHPPLGQPRRRGGPLRGHRPADLHRDPRGRRGRRAAAAAAGGRLLALDRPGAAGLGQRRAPLQGARRLPPAPRRALRRRLLRPGDQHPRRRPGGVRPDARRRVPAERADRDPRRAGAASSASAPPRSSTAPPREVDASDDADGETPESVGFVTGEPALLRASSTRSRPSRSSAGGSSPAPRRARPAARSSPTMRNDRLDVTPGARPRAGRRATAR